MSSKPVHTIRYGKISAFVYENDGKQKWFSVSFRRSFVDDKGVHREANSFGKDDLLYIAEASRQAFLWIAAQGSNTVSETGDPPACQ